MSARHRIDVRGNVIESPSIWPVIWAMLITFAVGAALLLAGGTVAQAYPDDIGEQPVVSYSCDEVST